MTSLFTPNYELLAAVRTMLSAFENIFWVIGGSNSGKSTICQEISTRRNMPVYDMDKHIFGLYMGRYTWKRHPASMSWFSAENPLGWAISLSLDEFDSLNRAANIEYLDQFAKDMNGSSKETPTLVDGGITHPSILAQVISPARILCIGLEPEEGARSWNTDPGRLPMKQMVLDLDSVTATWEKFLEHDKLITETIQRESQEAGIVVLPRVPGTSVENLSSAVMRHFGIQFHTQKQQSTE